MAGQMASQRRPGAACQEVSPGGLPCGGQRASAIQITPLRMLETGTCITLPNGQAAAIASMSASVAPRVSPDQQRILEAAAALRMAQVGSDSPASLNPVLCDDNVGADELAARIQAQPMLTA